MHTLRCYRCDRTYDDPDRKRCDCGEPVWFDVDPADGSIREDARGLARYLDFLPVEEPVGLGTGAGDTPCYRGERLSGFAGCDLYLKDESRNPTGSFKDRGSAVGVARAVERGLEAVGTVSHGNMAMSMAANAASVGLDCHVFVPDDIPEGRLDYIAQFDPELVQVAGDYGRLYYETIELGRDHGIDFVNSDAPLRVAGQKTTGMEIVDALDDPDAVVLPVSSGGHASAVWKGLRDLRDAGETDDLPRLYFVQSAACDPVATAFREGADEVEKQESDETIAYSIANGDPPSGRRALTAARETGGAVVSVDDGEILAAIERLATGAGICAEPSSATSLAGVRKLVADGRIDRDETAVAVVTGTGFTEEIRSETRSPTPVDLADLGGYLADALE